MTPLKPSSSPAPIQHSGTPPRERFGTIDAQRLLPAYPAGCNPFSRRARGLHPSSTKRPLHTRAPNGREPKQHGNIAPALPHREPLLGTLHAGIAMAPLMPHGLTGSPPP